MRHGKRMLWTWLPALAACLLVAACAQAPKGTPAYEAAAEHGQPPLIQLAPASLGQAIAEQQRLALAGPSGQRISLDAMLEVDSQSVRLAFLQMGQVVARLEWDGQALRTTQVPQWPEQVSAERILSDLQFARWPLAAVRQALPPPWTMVQEEDTRHLRNRNEDAVTFTTRPDGQTDIHYLQSGWRLTIHAHPVGTATRGPQ